MALSSRRFRPTPPAAPVQQAALDILARREHSGRELARKLRRRGYDREAIAGVLSRLGEVGLVSDERYARLYVRDRLSVSPQGKRRIVLGLRQKGVEPELAERAVDEVYLEEGVSESDLAEALARKRGRSLTELDPVAARRRLTGFLARRGFRGSVVTDAVRAALGSDPEEG